MLEWKFKEHRLLRKMGVNHNLMMDLLSKNYRKKYFKIYNEKPIEIARSLGCLFSEKTPGWALREIFVEEIYNVDGFVPAKGDIVADIGAFYGDSSIYWSKVKQASVIAFEALTSNFLVLKENIDLNNASIKAYNVALGDGNNIRASEDGKMLSTDTGGDYIQTKRLDDFSFDRLDLIKIDVEGFEEMVLHGSVNTISTHRPKIIIETHSKYLASRCNDFIINQSYILTKIVRSSVKIVKGSWMDQVENRFYIPDS